MRAALVAMRFVFNFSPECRALLVSCTFFFFLKYFSLFSLRFVSVKKRVCLARPVGLKMARMGIWDSGSPGRVYPSSILPVFLVGVSLDQH